MVSGRHGAEAYFNPRTHEGCDDKINEIIEALKDFNPRTHEGCDVALPVLCVIFPYISIHAPTKGATG